MPRTLDRLCLYLASQPYDWEIIVVSNGSTDSTCEAARLAQKEEPRIRLLDLVRRGKGMACRAGALASRGDIVFLCDADLSMPPECIESFLVLTDAADLVVGSREASGSHRFHEPAYRHFMGRMFNMLVRLIAVPDVQDTQCGFKALRRDAANTLFGTQTLDGWGFDVELLFLARKLGYRTAELGIPWYFDADSRVRAGIDTASMLRELLLVRWRSMRGVYTARRPSPEETAER